MTMYKRVTLAAFAVVVFATMAAGLSLAGDPARHVVADQEIQAQIDRQAGQATADREAIQTMLQRPEVRRIAGTAGLSLERANAAAAVLSGPSLQNLAAQARLVNSGLAGGDSTVVISATALIIILLLIILIAR
jgi:hypothetical protein